MEDDIFDIGFLSQEKKYAVKAVIHV